MLPKKWAHIFGWVVTAVAADESFDYVSGNTLYPSCSAPDSSLDYRWWRNSRPSSGHPSQHWASIIPNPRP